MKNILKTISLKAIIANFKTWDLNTFTFLTIIFALATSFIFPEMSMTHWFMVQLFIGYPIGLFFAWLHRDKNPPPNTTNPNTDNSTL